MDDFDELKKRKEKLLLEQEIARLERKRKLKENANKQGLHWLWMVPLVVICLAMLFNSVVAFFGGGSSDGEEAFVLLLLAVAGLFLVVRRLLK